MNGARYSLHREASRIGVVLGATVLAGCCGMARRPALGPQDAAPERPAVLESENTVAGDPDRDEPPKALAAPVLQAEVREWNGRPLIVVETEVPGPRWRAVLVPLPVTEESAREFRLVLVPPTEAGDGAERAEIDAAAEASSTPIRQTVLSSETFPDSVEQIVLYGTDDALVVPTS